MPQQPAVLGAARLGNFRLGHVSAALGPARRNRLRILLGGVDVSRLTAASRVRIAGLTIHDALNDAPNTAVLTVQGVAPVVGQDLRISINSDTPRLLFNGTLQSVETSYEGRPTQVAWPCSAIDDLARLNQRRPFGTWVNVSATTIATDAAAAFAPGFTTAHVDVGLPLVSIIADGTEEFSAFFSRLATAIGGYFYAEDLDIHLFQIEGADTPDPIDTSHPFLNDPPITMHVDSSQLRTRLYGKGHGEAASADVAAGGAVIPLADTVMFNPLGGRAIAGTTSDGAQSQRLTYTGIQLGGVGSLVGPGVSPSVPPALERVGGTGLGTGVYVYGFTHVTASGESLLSPLAAIETGILPAPTASPTPSTLLPGGALGVGTYQYGYTFVATSGETTISPLAAVTTSMVANPTVAPSLSSSAFGGTTSYPPGLYEYGYCWRDSDGGLTLMSPTAFITAAAQPGTGGTFITTIDCPPNPAPHGAIMVFRRVGAGPFEYCLSISYYEPSAKADTYPAVAGAAPPLTNTTMANRVPLAVPVGPAGTASRNVYRTVVNGSALKFLTSISDNTTAGIVPDGMADGGLGAAPPGTNTAAVRQVNVNGVALGPTGTTARRIYRTVANGAQLKLAGTIANNTGITFADGVPDVSLGADAPTGDTSGFTTVTGQVNAGATTLLTAGAGAFSAAGGFVVLSGDQVVRYTGISGNTLTGIPASGAGAILTTVPYGSPVVAAPALVGVTGLVLALQKGTTVSIWVQRDDLAAQAARAAVDASQGRTTNGVVEYTITDERRGEASLIARCDAELVQFSRPLVTVTYATRDVKTKSGKTIVVDLASPPIHETLTIQTVDITEIDVAPDVAPRFTVSASSARFSLDDILKILLAGPTR